MFLYVVYWLLYAYIGVYRFYIGVYMFYMFYIGLYKLYISFYIFDIGVNTKRLKTGTDSYAPDRVQTDR